GPQPGEKEEDYRKRVETLDRQAEELDKDVNDRLNHHVVNAGKARALDRARDALRRGLAAQALTVLLESDVVEFGPAGAQLELELLLTTGRLEEARRLMNDTTADLEHNLGDIAIAPYFGVSAYHWYELLLAAAE